MNCYADALDSRLGEPVAITRLKQRSEEPGVSDECLLLAADQLKGEPRMRALLALGAGAEQYFPNEHALAAHLLLREEDRSHVFDAEGQYPSSFLRDPRSVLVPRPLALEHAALDSEASRRVLGTARNALLLHSAMLESYLGNHAAAAALLHELFRKAGLEPSNILAPSSPDQRFKYRGETGFHEELNYRIEFFVAGMIALRGGDADAARSYAERAREEANGRAMLEPFLRLASLCEKDALARAAQQDTWPPSLAIWKALQDSPRKDLLTALKSSHEDGHTILPFVTCCLGELRAPLLEWVKKKAPPSCAECGFASLLDWVASQRQLQQSLAGEGSSEDARLKEIANRLRATLLERRWAVPLYALSSLESVNAKRLERAPSTSMTTSQGSDQSCERRLALAVRRPVLPGATTDLLRLGNLLASDPKRAVSLLAALRPDSQDYQAVFAAAEAGSQENAGVEAWARLEASAESPSLISFLPEKGDETFLTTLTPTDLRRGGIYRCGKKYADGSRSNLFRPNLSVHCLGFAQPGSEPGDDAMIGPFIYVNGHWALFLTHERRRTADTPCPPIVTTANDPIELPRLPPTPTPQPGSAADAKRVLQRLFRRETARAELLRLRPSSKDYRAVYQEPFAKHLEEALAPGWERVRNGGELLDDESVLSDPEDDIVYVRAEKSENIGSAESQLPVGYRSVARAVKPGLVIFAYSFTRLGWLGGIGMDGLIHVNGHWVLIPRPWTFSGTGAFQKPQQKKFVE